MGLRTFVFGLASGLSMTCLELALFPIAALSVLLAVRRKVTKSAAAGLLGFAIGYAPAIVQLDPSFQQLA